MKALVVYYSLTGHTGQVAQAVAKALGCESEAIREPRPRKPGLGYARCGMEATLRLKPRILPLQHDLNQYDTIIVGTPVWGWSMSSPVRSFLTCYQGQLKRVAFFWTSGGPMDDALVRKLEQACGRQAAASLGVLGSAAAAGQFSSEVQAFVSRLLAH